MSAGQRDLGDARGRGRLGKARRGGAGSSHCIISGVHHGLAGDTLSHKSGGTVISDADSILECYSQAPHSLTHSTTTLSPPPPHHRFSSFTPLSHPLSSFLPSLPLSASAVTPCSLQRLPPLCCLPLSLRRVVFLTAHRRLWSTVPAVLAPSPPPRY